MQDSQLLNLAGVFAASLVMLLLILRAIPDKSKFNDRLKRATGKGSAPKGKPADKSKPAVAVSPSQSQKSDIIFRTLGTDASALDLRIRRAGWSISPIEFLLIYVLIALVLATLATIAARMITDDFPLLYTVPGGVIGGFLILRLWLSIAITRRLNAVNDVFPDALDLMVRSLRTGVPIIETFKLTAENTLPPVGTEFQRIYNDIKFGLPLSEAIWRTAERIPSQEFIFFAISVSIQAETGGNLTENLEKLAAILRNRRQVKRMIKTKSAEALRTAKIFMALPIVFIGALYFIAPSYIEVFVKDERGHTAGMIMGGMILTGMFLTNRMTKFGY